MTRTTHVMIDIEALGLRPGAAIIELAACAFCPETGQTGELLELLIEPHAPFSADLETLAWHAKRGSWPRSLSDSTHAIGSALVELECWLGSLGTVDALWSWGATYDFPLLQAAYDFAGQAPPWKYWQCRCARTVWQVAFGDRKHAVRSHTAVDDALDSAADLMAAMGSLRMHARAMTPAKDQANDQ